MKLEKGHIYFGVACMIIGVLLGAGFHSCGNGTKPEPTVPTVIHDTVTVKDTVRIAGKTKTLYVTKWDTLRIESHVTDSLSDTCLCDGYVTVPIECKEYRDTFTTDSSRIELGVQFSGYEAKIDNIDLQYRFDVKPRTIVKKKGWGQFIGIGIGAGYGVSVINQQVYAAPEVGVHITYGWGYHW